MKPSFNNLRDQIDMDVADVDTDGFLDGATGAGPFVTFLAAVTPDGLAHQLNITSGDDISSITLTIVGTDADDLAQTEDVAGPAATTVETTKYFKTLTSITASATLDTNTMDVGWVDEAVSRTIPLDDGRTNAAAVSVDHTGTANWTIQTTSCNVDRRGDAAPFDYADQEDLFWFDDGNFTSKSADTHNQLALKGRTAMRFKFNSYTNGAEVQIFITHPG